MIHIALVDDDEQCAQTLRQFLERYGEETGNPFHVSVYRDGLSFLEDARKGFDIVFLDIKMPMLNGMDTAHRLRRQDSGVCIIFITTMAQYAIKGYEVNALDFIVKPVFYPDFKYRLAKALQYAARRKSDDLVLAFDHNVRRVAISDIEYVEVKHRHLVYHTAQEEIEVSDSLTSAEKKLQGHGFFKCNSGYLVNLRMVNEVKGSMVRLGETWLAISRPKRKAFLDELTAYVGG